MADTDFPEPLRLVTWEKKKGSLPPGNELADKLKLLQRQHDAVNWKAFEPGWAQKARTLAELDGELARRDKAWRAATAPLKKIAGDAGTAAQRMAKNAAKPVQDAAKAIVSAAAAYEKSLDAGIAELQQAHAAAKAALGAAAADEDDDESGATLLDPKKLLSQLQALARDPERRAQFAFVDGADKKPSALTLHPKTSGRSLFAKLQQETELKPGAHGSAWIDEKTLVLQVEKPYGGLVKKVKPPIKACGFRVAKVVVWGLGGAVLEQDDAPEGAEAAADAAQQAETLKTALMPRLRKLLEAPGLDASLRNDLMALANSAAGLLKSGASAEAVGMLGKLQEMLDRASGTAAPTAVAETPAERFTARLKALKPALGTPAATGNAQALKLVAEMSAAAKTQDYAKALALVAQIEALLAPSADGFPARWAAAKERYEAASDLVNGQIDKLQAALRNEPDDELRDIAEYGLNAVTGDQRVPVVAAMLDVDRADAESRAAKAQRAKAAIERFQSHLANDERVAACDENPFGVPLAIRGTLGPALADLALALDAA